MPQLKSLDYAVCSRAVNYQKDACLAVSNSVSSTIPKVGVLGQYELTTRWTMGMKLGVLVRTQVLRRYLRTEGGATGDQRPEASDH
eukprot:3142919-Pyramimonas_sp.AAC.1